MNFSPWNTSGMQNQSQGYSSGSPYPDDFEKALAATSLGSQPAPAECTFPYPPAPSSSAPYPQANPTSSDPYGGYPKANSASFDSYGGYPQTNPVSSDPYGQYPQPTNVSSTPYGGYPSACPVSSTTYDPYPQSYPFSSNPCADYPQSNRASASPYGGYPQSYPANPNPMMSTYDQYNYGGQGNFGSTQGQSNEDVYRPTVKPHPNFDPNMDCERLRKAMKGAGHDSKPIIEIMTHRSADQRVQLVRQFKTMYGRDLIRDFQSELHGHFEDVIVGLCYSQVEFLARQLRGAMQGAGTDERALIEILAPQSNDMIAKLKSKYREIFPGRSLERDIQDETSRSFRHLIISLCQGNRDERTHVNTEEARRDAQELYNAGEKKVGTDNSVFNKIMVSKSYSHLREVFRQYKMICKRDIETSLKSEMHSDLLQGHLAIVRCIENKPQYFAHELYKAMNGAGTRDNSLIRLVISRCEIDMGAIKEAFHKLFGKSLEHWITSETSRDYRTALLSLVKG